MAKKVCISGYYGFRNFGDEAVLSVLIDNLRQFDSAIDITVFSSDPDYTKKEYRVRSVNSFKIFDVIRAIKNTDLLISGGGSLLQDATSKKSLIYYLFIIFLAAFFKKKIVIFAQGIGPIQSEFLQKIAIALLKKASYISVRDENSKYYLQRYGINPVMCIDPVWNIDVKDPRPQGRIGIQLRNWKTMSEDFLRLLAVGVIKYFPNHDVLIYPFQSSTDSAICQKFSTYLKSLNPDCEPEIVFCDTRDEIVNSFSTLNALIAMRFHACVVGIKTGIKTLPISYDIKVDKIANDFSLKTLKLDRPDTIDEIVREFSTSENKLAELDFTNYRFRYEKFSAALSRIF